MATSDKERSRAYRQRQAELQRDLKSKGLMSIKVITATAAMPAVERICQATADLYLNQHEDVTDDMLDASRRDLLASFLASGSPQMVEFRKEGIGAVGVKMIPWHSTPVLVTHPLMADTDVQRLREQFPLLARVRDLSAYHWKTPAYVTLCADLGIDYLWHAPTFHSEYEDLAWSLLDWDVEVFPQVSRGRSGDVWRVRNFVFDVLDMLRIDENRSKVSPPGIQAEMLELGDLLSIFRLPHLSRLQALCAEPARLDLKDVSSPVATTIRFLPSAFGGGYLASIYGWSGNHEPDGWVPGTYDDLHGVAVMPAENELKFQWKKTAVAHLRENGVLFLTKGQAGKYMEHEGAYWQWRHGRRHDTSLAQHVLWAVSKPVTPVSDRAVELAQAARLLRSHSSLGAPGGWPWPT